MWRFNFFAERTFHNTALLSYAPEPSRNLQLEEKQKTNPKLIPSRSLHLNEELIFPARTFRNTALLSYEPEASRSLQLKEKPKTNPKLKPSRSLHLNEMLYKGGKTMWRFHFFCSVSFPSQYLPRDSPFELRTRTFQKPTTR